MSKAYAALPDAGSADIVPNHPMNPSAYPAILNGPMRPGTSFPPDTPSPEETAETLTGKPSDADLLRTANHWGQATLFGTIADPLWLIILAFCAVPVLLLSVLSVIIGTWFDALAPQCILACATFVSLRLLSKHPMINPVQVVVLYFHWWFGYGPCVCSTVWYLRGDLAKVDLYLSGQMTQILIVALGLPLYAGAASWILGHWKGPQLNRVVPDGPVYETRTLLRISGVAVSIALILQVFGLFGLHAYANTDYLFGRVSETWWLVPIEEAGRLGDFVVVSACSILAVPNLRKNATTRWVLIGIAILAFQRSLTSGSKSTMVLPVFYFIVAFVNWRRRLPWLFLAAALVGYLVVVEPFVASIRLQAERAKAVTTEQRIEIFTHGWRDFKIDGPGSSEVNVESPFRGIYLLATQITDQSSFMDGPWKGESVNNGLSALVPRVLSPGKANSNMGNFFAHQLGISRLDNVSNNVAITIPFEIVGNYGWLAGWLSFAVLGILWASFVAFVLTVPRMATHPLTPYLIGFVIAIESSVGQFGNSVKLLLIPIAVFCWVYRIAPERP